LSVPSTAEAAATGAGRLSAAVEQIDGWGAANAAAAVIGRSGVLASRGDPDHGFALASVTKLVTTLSVLIAAERELLDLDEPAGPPGATVRHLLAHASGLPFDGDSVLAAPGTRRIYSNTGFDRLGDIVAERAGVSFDAVLAEWIFAPLGMTAATLLGRPSRDLQAPLRDLVTFARELLAPTLLPSRALAIATRVAFPGLKGVVPGVGNFDPCDWGLGFELHDAKAPHWMGLENSPETFGHFGGAGTFLWVDPVADLVLVVLTDREFGPWALQAWPALSDDLLSLVSV
jgi:CubicO group peptidase (beta-lactamase class C family)